MTEFLLMFACVVSAPEPQYKDGAYNATITITCSDKAFKREFMESVANQDAVRQASLSITHVGDKVVAISKVIVERPWIAPVPIFMSVAAQKHQKIVIDKLKELYES